ncbi:MAG: hypothetical protein Ta2B_05710 [Termitinemataceae bacterium]|nr:MAG: hypothetical protein Ta2B_05710 [Termitinemataceae bacterium]
MNEAQDYTLDDIEKELDNIVSPLNMDAEENIIPLFEDASVKIIETDKTSFSPFGAWSDFDSRLSAAERKTANDAAIDVLAHTLEDALPTEQERAVLSRYSGFGGIDANDERGVLYDYYTSPPVADMTWKLLDKIDPVQNDESVLEPSCGTGVFFETAPGNVKLTGVELDERTAAVAKVLHKDKAEIINQSFEQFNITNGEAKYDRVIGNAPFGVRPPDTASLDMPGIKSLDNYFVTRCIDNLKDDGTMALIVAPGVLENKSNEDFRLSLSKKAQFVGAVKLPNKSFNHTHTQVEPDILLFRKYPQDIIRRIEGMSDEKFKETDLYNDFFVSGNYFSGYSRHIMGELSEGSGQWGRDEVKGGVSAEGIEKILTDFLPFEKIDYESIRSEFDEVIQSENNNDYLYLTKEESERLANKSLTQGSIKVVHDKAYLLDDNNVWKNVSNDQTFCLKLGRLKLISTEVNLIRAEMQNGNVKSTLLEQDLVKTLLDSYLLLHKTYPADDKDIKRFLTANPAVKGIYEGLITPQAEILTSENIYNNNAQIVDGHNPAIEALVKLQEMNLPASAENIARNFPDNADALIHEMWNNPDVFIESAIDTTFVLRENFIAGDAWEKIDALQAEAEQTDYLLSDEKTKAKLLYGASELQKAVGWSEIEEVEFSPHSSWITQDIIKEWVNSKDGLDADISGLTKNEEGKWGQILETDKSEWVGAWNNRKEVITPAGTWMPLNDPLIYYLNSQKQRSRGVDTKVYNDDMNESFKTFIANHKEYRNSLEEIYNRTFKTNISAPVKTYSVNIDGWIDAGNGGKDLKPHQWQTIHHLYRQGSGISALGVGFGKTLSGVGLMSLLRQEGQVKRVWLQVPNNKVKDWVEEIKAVMPGLKIASIDPEEPGYSNQTKRYAKYQSMASSGADIIIMPESAASEIQLQAENDKIIQDKIARHFASDKKSKRDQELAKITGLEQTQNGKTNKTVCFEDFGCDALFVDEAHNYKNLFPSSLARETGINDGRRSDRAMSLFKKSEYIRNNHDDKNVFLFTATPLTNSPLEYYNMLQYVAPKELERFGINTIDNFIKEFAKIERGMIMDWKKDMAKEGNILTGFKNLDTLQKLFFKYTDFQNDPDAIGLEKPTADIHQNRIPKDETQLKVMKAIADELERYITMEADQRKIKFEGQNFLTFFGQFRTASLDLELFDPQTFKDWKNPKLQTLAKNAFELYNNTKAGQVIFCDRVVSRDESFNMHEKIKAELVAQGFKESEIVIVNGITKTGSKKSDSAVEREVSQAIKDYNSGKYKVIIGTTGCIGEGVNLQKNSSGLHHFDIPFRPSDFIQRNGRIDRQGNEQENVQLHTYMSVGTLDSNSVQRVQIKSNWIDQLLKTKSNVFANPNDENAIDGEELLLALSEEWGDTEKAAERRAEMERIKAEKIAEAYNKQRIGYMKTLSTMRGSLQSANLKPEGKEYKNRMDKIHNIETALKNNPTFKRHDLLENNEVFLYNSALDEVFRKDDIIFVNDVHGIIQSLNPKKSEVVFSDFDGNGYKIFEVKKFDSDYNWAQGKVKLSAHFEKADAKQIAVSKNILSENFYTDFDSETKEEFYLQHLELTYKSNATYKPVVFYTKDDKLEIKYHFGAYDSEQIDKIVNPFSAEGINAIKTAANNGFKYNQYMKEDILKETLKTLPHLHDVIAEGIEKAEREGSVIHADEDADMEIEERSAGSIRREQTADVVPQKNIIGEDNMTDGNLEVKQTDELEQDSILAQENKGQTQTEQKPPITDYRSKYEAMGANYYGTDFTQRMAFNFRAIQNLHDVKTKGLRDLTPEESFAYKQQYNSKFLPKMPLEAWQFGKPIEPQKAFELLCSGVYFDLKENKFVNLKGVTLEQHNIEKYALGIGGREYRNEETFAHRIYFTPEGKKTLFGLETTGTVELTPEEQEQYKTAFNTKFLPAFPEEATMHGEKIDPKKAFELMNAKVFYDVHKDKMSGMPKGTQTFVSWANTQKQNLELPKEQRQVIADKLAAYDMRIKTNITNAKNAIVRDADLEQNTAQQNNFAKTEMTPAQQLHSLMKEAVQKDNVPWQKDFKAGERQIPHDAVNTKPLLGNNLYASVLHMESIGSKDPRYFEDRDVPKTLLKENANPLKLSFTKKDKETGKIISETKTFYNAADINKCPPYEKTVVAKTENDIVSERGFNAKDQFTKDMASFAMAIKSDRGFVSQSGAFTKTEYEPIKDLPFNSAMQTFQAANNIMLEKKGLQFKETEQDQKKVMGLDQGR